MTLIGYDSVTLANVPTDAAWVGCYVDGMYANEAEARQRFPNAHIATITVLGGDADVADCEQGDLTPAGAAAWVQRRKAAGLVAIVYCNTSTWAAVQSECARLGVTPDGYWIAQYDHNATIPDNWVNAGCAAKQYIGDENGRDTSTVLDTWPGLTPPAPPAPTPQPDDEWLVI